MLPPTGVEPTSFWNSASKVAGLQVHAATPAIDNDLLICLSHLDLIVRGHQKLKTNFTLSSDDINLTAEVSNYQIDN